MQPTVPAWLSWYRRVRPRARADRIAVYTFGGDEPATHLIRLDSVLGSKRKLAPAPARAPWRSDRFPPGTEPWRVPGPIMPDINTRFHFEPISIVLPAAPPTTEIPTPQRAHAWGSAARGWAAGTVLLAVLVLLVRTAEKCLDKKLFHLRRRQSEEWPTPNVLATSHQNQNNTEGGEPRLDDSDAFPSDSNRIDLPPPYSECANADNFDPNKLDIIEEPPPPYSACYVSFSNPKDGTPSVHFFNGQQGMFDSNAYEIGHSSSEDVQNNLIGVRSQEVSSNHSGDSTELVFENGRIVERKERDLDSINNALETNVEIGESSPVVNERDLENGTQDRVVIV